MDAMEKRKFLIALMAILSWPTFAAESIGSTANGCIVGAGTLAPEGTGYQVVRLERRRFYGHPALLGAIRSLGQEAAAKGWGTLLVDDLSQERGGPMPNGHGSHQNGLDADILFDLPATPLDAAARESPPQVEVVAAGGGGLESGQWRSSHVALLEAAAQLPEVDRIFVHPAIKRELCATVQGERGWLRKIRPWWGHTEHFHLRLACPNDSPDCLPQPALPAGEGCGRELDWWFGPEAALAPKSAAKPALPPRCVKLLAE